MGGVEMDPAQGEGLTAVAVGEQTKVAEFDEAGRRDVKQKAADELDRVEGHDCTCGCYVWSSAAKAPLLPTSDVSLLVLKLTSK